MVAVTPLDAEDDARFDLWYAALRASAVAGRQAPVVVPAETLRRQLRDQTRVLRRPLGVFEGDRCLGTGLLEWDTGHNPHLGEVDVEVVPEHRRRGIGSALLQQLLDTAAAAGLTTLVAEVHAVDPAAPGLAFASHSGFATVHTEHRLLLDLPLAPARLDELAAMSTAAEHGYRLTSWVGATPQEHLEALARLRTGMNAEVPTGDVDADPEVVTAEELAVRDRRLEERGYLALVSLSTDPDGQPVAYSLMYAQREDPANVVQDDTYVLRAHRGRHLASWLKAANLRTLQAAVPQARHVHTWTDEVNDAMQAVNAHVGFRPVEVMHQVQRGRRPGSGAQGEPG